MEYVIMEVDSSEPDSTVVIEEEAQPSDASQTAMQRMNRNLIENQNLCANLLAASVRERDRVRAELSNAQRNREAVMADLRFVFKLRETAKRSCMNAKLSLHEATAKRCALLKEIENVKMWRPPSVVMSLKKQQELRERVENMRALLRVQIRAPDEIQ